MTTSIRILRISLRMLSVSMVNSSSNNSKVGVMMTFLVIALVCLVRKLTRITVWIVIGVNNRPNATKQEIKLAHKKMLMKYHPDHGGSTEMASKINQARDVLLGKN